MPSFQTPDVFLRAFYFSLSLYLIDSIASEHIIAETITIKVLKSTEANIFFKSSIIITHAMAILLSVKY